MTRNTIRWMRLKLQGIYSCRCCGAKGAGDIYDVEASFGTADDVAAILARRPPARAMPVGWGSYTDGFQCPACTTKQEGGS